MADTTQHTS